MNAATHMFSLTMVVALQEEIHYGEVATALRAGSSGQHSAPFSAAVYLLLLLLMMCP